DRRVAQANGGCLNAAYVRTAESEGQIAVGSQNGVSHRLGANCAGVKPELEVQRGASWSGRNGNRLIEWQRIGEQQREIGGLWTAGGQPKQWGIRIEVEQSHRERCERPSSYRNIPKRHRRVVQRKGRTAVARESESQIPVSSQNGVG